MMSTWELVVTSIPSFPILHLSAHGAHWKAVDETGLYVTSRSSVKSKSYFFFFLFLQWVSCLVHAFIFCFALCAQWMLFKKSLWISVWFQIFLNWIFSWDARETLPVCSVKVVMQSLVCVRRIQWRDRGGMDLRPVPTMVWHYESWRPLCLTPDVFWSSRWASGEKPGESSAKQHRAAAEILNGSEIWSDFGVNVF